MPALRSGHPNQQDFGAIDDVTLLPVAPSAAGGAIYMAGFVWDPIGLAWVKATQSGGGSGGGGAVTQSGVWSVGRTWTLASGTDSVAAVIASLPLPSGASTEATLAAINATLTAGTVQLAAGSNVGAATSTRGIQMVGSDYSGAPLARVPKVDAAGLQYVALPTGAAQDGTDITTPTAMPAGGTGIRGWLSAIWTKLNGTLAVTGTFFQATQPVSAAALPLPAGASTETTLAALNTKMVAKAASTAAATTDASVVVAMHPLSPAFFKASDVVGTNLSAANTAGTLTVAAGGAGLFLYITRIRITMHNTSAAAVAGSAVVLAFTSTNIPGSLAWTEGNALAAGTSKTVVDEYLDSPIKTSSAAAATTIVCPACGAGIQARATIYGYYAP